MAQRKVIGIIGGVGPSATIDLYRWIVALTPAQKDQDHLRIIIDNHAQIPDRPTAIFENSETPVPYFLESVRLLERAGAQILGIPCNTAHYFLPRLQEKTSTPFIDMIEETGKEIQNMGIAKVGLLSTSATVKTGIYSTVFQKLGIETCVPSEQGMKLEMAAIYGPRGIKERAQYEKTLENKNRLLQVIEELKEQGAKVIIMGCTEIPLCLEENDTDLPLINPTRILAKALIREALN